MDPFEVVVKRDALGQVAVNFPASQLPAVEAMLMAALAFVQRELFVQRLIQHEQHNAQGRQLAGMIGRAGPIRGR